MAYSINFTRQALKELEKINAPFYTGIQKAIVALSLDPWPAGYKKLRG